MKKGETASARTTLKQIALAAGVSVMTVSRALKDHPHLAKATKARIRKIARNLDYRPHPYISALMSGLAQARAASATVNLAVMHFEQGDQPLRHLYYRGIATRARELGYQAEPFLCGPGAKERTRLRRIFLARGIRGIIILPAPEGFTSIEFNFEGFSVATLGYTVVTPPLPRVANDIPAGTFQALDALVERGYRRIGLINTERVNRLSRFLYSGAFLAYRDHVARQCHLAELTAGSSAGPARDGKIKQWVLREKLDAVISSDFNLPLYDLLLRQGFDIPGKLGYLHLLDYANPKVSCLGQNGEFMGAKAVDMVVAAINRNEFQPSARPHMIATPPEWRKGGETLPYRNGRTSGS